MNSSKMNWFVLLDCFSALLAFLFVNLINLFFHLIFCIFGMESDMVGDGCGWMLRAGRGGAERRAPGGGGCR